MTPPGAADGEFPAPGGEGGRRPRRIVEPEGSPEGFESESEDGEGSDLLPGEDAPLTAGADFHLEPAASAAVFGRQRSPEALGLDFAAAASHGSDGTPAKAGRHRAPGASGVAGTAANMVTAMIGSSILGLPAVFARTGLYLGVPMLLMTGSISVYLCHILSEAIGLVQDVRRTRIEKVDDLVLECFGAVGQRLTMVLLNTYFLAKTALYIVLIAQNLHYLAPSLPYRGWVLLVTVGSCPSAFLRDMTRVERLAPLGVAASLMYGVCIVAGAVEAAGRPTRRFQPQHSFETARDCVGTIFSTLGVMAFCFGPTDMVATLRREMREPEGLLQASVISHGTVMVIYLLAGIVGFWGFGYTVTGNVNLSMCDDPGCEGQLGVPPGGGGERWLSGSMLAVAVTVNLVATIPLVHFCLFSGIEASFPAHTPMRKAHSVTMRVGAVIVSAVVGILVPFFLHVLAIISAALAVPIVFILPVVASWKAARVCDAPPRAPLRCVLDSASLLLGALAFVLGCADSVASLAQAIREHPERADVFHNFWY